MQSSIKRVAGAPIFAVARTDQLPLALCEFKNPHSSNASLAASGHHPGRTAAGNNINLALDAECDSMKNAFEISTLLDTFRMVGSMALYDPRCALR